MTYCIPTAILLMLTAALGCDHTEGQKTSISRLEDSPTNAETRPPLNFNKFYASIESFKNEDLKYFKANWPRVRNQLHQYINDGSLQKLSDDQLESLWLSLEYLRSCRYPYILHQHGEEIAKILISMDVPGWNESLHKILRELPQ